MPTKKDKSNGTYYYLFQKNGKRYKGRGFPTRAAASAAERERRQKLETGSRLLSEVFLEKMADYKLKGQNQTAAKMEQMWRCRISPYLEDQVITEYTAGDIEQLQSRLKAAGHSPNSLNEVKTRLGVIFNFAILHGYCDRNPFQRVTKVKNTRKPKAFWTEDDYRRAMLVKESQKNLATVALIFWTGIRRGEARGLEWQDFSREQKTITIRCHVVEDGGHAILPGRKNSSGDMTVPIDDELVSVLSDLQDQERKLRGYTDYWYITGYKRQMASQNRTGKILDRIHKKDSTVPRITAHGLRHSHVSWLFNNTNLTPQQIAHRIGDTVEVVLAVYAHLYDDTDQIIVDAINTHKAK